MASTLRTIKIDKIKLINNDIMKYIGVFLYPPTKMCQVFVEIKLLMRKYFSIHV